MPTTKTKKPLFDQVKLASQLSDLSHRAHDPQNLPFTSIRFSTDRKTFTFKDFVTAMDGKLPLADAVSVHWPEVSVI